jgi:predicted small lipoprotein YifL
MKSLRSALLLLALALALMSAAGCGNKGDLVRPTPKSDAPAGS